MLVNTNGIYFLVGLEVRRSPHPTDFAIDIPVTVLRIRTLAPDDVDTKGNKGYPARKSGSFFGRS
jgi:hypothetical protein